MNFELDITSVSTWRDFGRKIPLGSASGSILSNQLYVVFTRIESQAVIKVAKSSIKTIFRMSWVNTNKEKIIVR